MVKWMLTQIVGQVMRLTGIKARFSKDYRWGITRYHRAVYALICTFGCNIIADGGEWPLIH